MANNDFSEVIRRRPTAEQLRQEIARIQKKRRFPFLRILLFLIVILLIGVFTFLCLLSGFVVYGDSMEPALYEGDVLLAIPHAPLQPGDLVAFRHEDRILIKRAIAGPGEQIEVLTDGNVILNGVPLSEPYARYSDRGVNDMNYPLDIPSASWFVMGDNRGSSVDSRSNILGLIGEDQILGKVAFRIWPLNRLQLFDRNFLSDLPAIFRH